MHRLRFLRSLVRLEDLFIPLQNVVAHPGVDEILNDRLHLNVLFSVSKHSIFNRFIRQLAKGLNIVGKVFIEIHTIPSELHSIILNGLSRTEIHDKLSMTSIDPLLDRKIIARLLIFH